MLVRLCLFTLFSIFLMVSKADDALPNDDLPNDALPNDDLSNDDISNDEISDDDVSNDGFSIDIDNPDPEAPGVLHANKNDDSFSNGLAYRPRPPKVIPIEAEKTLKFVVGFYRHGTRAAFRGPYTGDPYSDVDKYFPDGPHELTKVGKLQSYNLGKFFRQRYGNFLGDIYNKSTTLFMSTGSYRSILSAELVAYGLYPAKSFQKWSDTSDWNPIAVSIDNYEIDKTIVQFNPGYCPKYDNLVNEALDKENKAANVKEAIKLLSRFTTDTFSTAVDVAQLFDYLQAQDLNGLELPEATKTFYPNKLKAVYADVLKASSAYNKDMINLTAGPLMNYMKSLLLGKMKKTLNPNYFAVFFSGHDTTIYPMLAALGMKKSMNIDPATAFLFEIHDISGVPVIKLFYVDQSNTKKPITEMGLPNCGRPYCRLNTALRKFDGFLESAKWKNACAYP